MPRGKAIRILVADDNEINQRLIERMLAYKGYEVHTVSNGAEVLDALETEHYDLVIMDCLMPVVDGFAATRAIRASRSGNFDPGIPVLAITALATLNDREKCLDSGMSDYISKPVVAERLFRKVCDLLSPASSPLPAPDPPQDSLVPQILSTLSQRLLADIAEWQTHLDESGFEGRLQDAALLAHKIRGTADVFGADKLSIAAAQLETAARTDGTGDIRSLMTALRHELVSLEQSIRSGL